MAMDIITKFELDEAKLEILRECMENYNVGSDEAQWPNNILSRQTVVYRSGVMARRDADVRHSVDLAELVLCRRLAAEAADLMDGVDVGMGSESSDPFREFYIVANVDEAAPARIDEQLIRSKFGDTIFPVATITVEPLSEAGVWWSEVERDGAESEEGYFAPWRAMIEWFQSQPEFVERVFVRIGDRQALWDLPREQWPAGTEITGCVLPRLVLGLTAAGSLVGLFGFSVQT